MARFYDDAALARLGEAYADLVRSCMRLQERCLTYKFKNERAQEFARHGLARRLSCLVRSITNTFSLLPPELDQLPPTDSLHDAEIQIQAFVINVFGCIDNLAWIWVEERNVKNPKNGEALPPAFVGLRPKNEIVMDSLDVALRKYLEGIAGWFDYLENYRHALAHQIPLYIPPYGVRRDREQRYRELEAAILENTVRGNLAELDALKREQDQQKVFQPYIMHSYLGGARPMPFHWQMLCDFRTIEPSA
jgi:hypothetical protein